MKTKPQYYVDAHKLEETWSNWLHTNDQAYYEDLCLMFYKVADGIAKKFYPKTEEEHQELTNQAYVMAIDKLKRGVLKFKPGKASVFNLLTTAIYNLLYSYKVSEKRKKNKIKKYATQKFGISIGE